MKELDNIIKNRIQLEEEGYSLENNFIKSLDVDIVGHFNNAVCLRISCHDVVPCSFYVNTSNIGYLIKAFVELFGLSKEDGIRMSEISNIPCRLVMEKHSRAVGFGHYMDDKFVLTDEFARLGKNDEQK